MRRKEERVQGMGVLLKKVQRGEPLQSAQGPPDRKGPVCPRGRYVLPANTVFPIDACQRDKSLSFDIFPGLFPLFSSKKVPHGEAVPEQPRSTATLRDPLPSRF